MATTDKKAIMEKLLGSLKKKMDLVDLEGDEDESEEKPSTKGEESEGEESVVDDAKDEKGDEDDSAKVREELKAFMRGSKKEKKSGLVTASSAPAKSKGDSKSPAKSFPFAKGKAKKG